MHEPAMLTEHHNRREAPTMQATIGLNGYFVAVSAGWQRMLGWNSAELVALPFIERIHPDDLDTVIATVHHLQKGGEQASFRGRFRRRDGTYVQLHWHARFQPEQLLLTVVVYLEHTGEQSTVTRLCSSG
jgi:PAS domain S-box-containing protein